MADARPTPAPRGKDTPEESPAPAQAKTGRQAAALTNQAEAVTLEQVYALLEEMAPRIKALYNIYFQDE